MLRSNPAKKTFATGGSVLGSEVSRRRSADAPRLFALAGFDFVFIDMEHTAFTQETVADMIAAARQGDIIPIVRVPQAGHEHAAGGLDLGAQGMIVPRVNSPAEVEEMLAIDGVDVACLGSMDLSVDMEIPEEFEHPRMYRDGPCAPRHAGEDRCAGDVDPEGARQSPTPHPRCRRMSIMRRVR